MINEEIREHIRKLVDNAYSVDESHASIRNKYKQHGA